MKPLFNTAYYIAREGDAFRKFTIKEERDESNQGGRQMDNTNRKCIFGNDLLQRTQSNVGFPASVAVGFFGHN